MNSFEDVLNWADNLIFNQTGKNLSEVQKKILEGTWQGKKYWQIAEELHCSESDVKKKAAKLWKKFRKDLGEDLNKSNFRYKVEKKYRVSQVSSSGDCLLQEIDINICGQFIQNIKDTQARSPSSPDTPQNKNKSPIINLKDAPKLTCNFHRTSEVSTLKQWILESNIHLITIYGLSRIGKSTLARQLIEQIKTEFDYIFWKSLNHILQLSTLETELKQFFSQSKTTPLSTIIDYFSDYRCLVILDDVENIFESGELAGNYLPDYKNYGKFFKQIATSSHQSCLILISWEKSREIATLETENHPIKTLHLKGLEKAEATKILATKAKELTDEEKWSELITVYQGHPTWLNIIAATIKEFYNGRVSQFLAEQNEIYLDNLEPILESHFERLSPSEKKVAYWLATQNEPVNICQRPANSELSKSDFLDSMKSLCRRSLIEKKELENQSVFDLNPVFKQYIVTKQK
ncbi:MAG: ATP-binding protein [Okeania sp. SIO3B5]|uniref:NB-ARC domain-containing protein n=1 Tax=Okeania sp. SIO3B5 TaxID=2607811 RepID=UPI001400415F|nr:NB-ARC domain-containing protein [Okeania sp. SIO3B5]NEO53398.1 ATP-binding protein [Okeania sp. SIO3B5]